MVEGSAGKYATVSGNVQRAVMPVVDVMETHPRCSTATQSCEKADMQQQQQADKVVQLGRFKSSVQPRMPGSGGTSARRQGAGKLARPKCYAY
jgi:hypothetical protein